MGKILLKRPEPVLDINKPFSDDRLQRSDIALALTNLIAEEQEPLVVALNGGWGTGKTFFLERWVQSLQVGTLAGKESPYVISYNAWQDDDLEDPLLALVGQIHYCLHARSPKNDPSIKEDAASKLDALGRAATESAGLLVKHAGRAVGHFIGIDPAELVKDFANYQAKRVVDYSAAIKARVDLKSRLGDVAAAVWERTGRPLIVVIDDLDRCRPSFAVSLLERVKHLFNVNHVVFVLGVDLIQFARSLRNVYGVDFDADNYLHRFIDFEFKLPSPSYSSYVDMLMNQYGFDQYLCAPGDLKNLDMTKYAINEFKGIAMYLADRYQMSLRALERVIRSAALIERIHLTRAPVDVTLIVLMSVLQTCDKEVYQELIDKAPSPKKILDSVLRPVLSRTKTLNSAETHIAIVVYASIRGSLSEDVFEDVRKCFSDVSYRERVLPERICASFDSLNDIVGRAMDTRIAHPMVEYVSRALQTLQGWKESEW